MISLVLAAALFAAAEPAAAPAAAATPTKSAKVEKPNKDGMICRKEAVIGSRMKARTCMTQDQWDARAAEDRDLVEQAQRNKPLQSN
ncbi:MAG: hypothetical protein AB1942_25685 [Pseudomonadota bacterium]